MEMGTVCHSHSKRIPATCRPARHADDALVFHGETQLDVPDVHG
jgi:hypothetical protein